IMLETFGVSEENWREAIDPDRPGGPTAPADFALSETPHFVGRAVAALAADPDRARWNQASVTSGQLAAHYGFTDLDGSRPDSWRYIETSRDRGGNADFAGFR